MLLELMTESVIYIRSIRVHAASSFGCFVDDLNGVGNWRLDRSIHYHTVGTHSR